MHVVLNIIHSAPLEQTSGMGDGLGCCLPILMSVRNMLIRKLCLCYVGSCRVLFGM